MKLTTHQIAKSSEVRPLVSVEMKDFDTHAASMMRSKKEEKQEMNMRHPVRIALQDPARHGVRYCASNNGKDGLLKLHVSTDRDFYSAY